MKLDLNKRKSKIGASELHNIFVKTKRDSKGRYNWLYNKIFAVRTVFGEFAQKCIDHGNKYEKIIDNEVKDFFKDDVLMQIEKSYPMYDSLFSCTCDYYFPDRNLLIELKCPYVRHISEDKDIKYNYMMQIFQQCIIFKADVVLLEIKVKDFTYNKKGYYIFCHKSRLLKYSIELENLYINLLTGIGKGYRQLFDQKIETDDEFEEYYQMFIV